MHELIELPDYNESRFNGRKLHFTFSIKWLFLKLETHTPAKWHEQNYPAESKPKANYLSRKTVCYIVSEITQ